MGVTDVISGAYREIALHGGHDGHDGDGRSCARAPRETRVEALSIARRERLWLLPVIVRSSRGAFKAGCAARPASPAGESRCPTRSIAADRTVRHVQEGATYDGKSALSRAPAEVDEVDQMGPKPPKMARGAALFSLAAWGGTALEISAETR